MSTPQKTQYKLWHYLMLCLTNVLTIMTRYAIVPIQAALSSELKFTDKDFGTLQSIFWLSFTISCLPFGYLGDKCSRRKFLILDLFMEGIGMAISAYSTEFYTFALGRAIVGFFQASFAIVGPTILADMFTDAQTRSVRTTIFAISLSLGVAIGFGFCSVLANLFRFNFPLYRAVLGRCAFMYF